MVGIPRSKGCKTCVQRRVRCDEGKPTCENCAKGGRVCLGYMNRFTFRDESSKLRRRYESSDNDCDNEAKLDDYNISPHVAFEQQDERLGLNKDSTDERQRDSNSRVCSCLVCCEDSACSPSSPEHELEPHICSHNQPGDRSNSSLPQATRHNEHDSKRKSNDLIRYQSVPSPMLIQTQLLHGFTEAVAPLTADFLPLVMKAQASWLRCLPDMTGSNALLDVTIRAVTLIQLGRQQKSIVLVNESRPLYGRALALLKRALQNQHEEAAYGIRTLCATALLSYYEIFASDDNASWIKHAGGVGALMQSRGPARHRHGLDREILRAYRHNLVIEALQKGTPCFLGEPEWRRILLDIYQDIKLENGNGNMSAPTEALFDLAELFFSQLIDIPDICVNAQIFLTSLYEDHHVGDDIKRSHPAANLRLETYVRLRAKARQLKETHCRFQVALCQIGQSPFGINVEDPVFPQQYVYGSVFLSIIHAGYRNAQMLISSFAVKLALSLIDNGHDLESDLMRCKKDNRELAVNSCQSIHYMLHGSFLGPLYALFGLRLALQVFPNEGLEYAWAVNKLMEISNTFFPMARQVPRLMESINKGKIRSH